MFSIQILIVWGVRQQWGTQCQTRVGGGLVRRRGVGSALPDTGHLFQLKYLGKVFSFFSNTFIHRSQEGVIRFSVSFFNLS